MATLDVLVRATRRTQIRYDRLAPFYDVMESLIERTLFGDLRRKFWAGVSGERILEVGVGTGKNLAHYPENGRMTAVDLSERMLDQARKKAKALGLAVDLRPMDVQALNFPDASFDTAVATFVFCSVPSPIEGLRELGRVVQARGDIWLMEHVRWNRPVAGRLMDLLNPLVVRVMGANINRQTVQNVKLAGLEIVDVEPLSGELVKLIHARPGRKV